jgi:sugar phosphate isomerase/epimerase
MPSMKFAFSTVSCPRWDFETIAARAREYGYDGVEVRGFLNETLLTAANVFLTDAGKVRRIFEDAGVEIACLSSSVLMTGQRKEDKRQAAYLRDCIDAAARLGCPLVKVFDTEVRPGSPLRPLHNASHGKAGVDLGNWLLPHADYAARNGVTLVIENALSFRAAKEMWTILDRLQHPAVACCWDVFNAALIGESPYLSVPVLNTKIQYTQVKDAKLGSLGATYCKLGEGDVPVRKFVNRLAGIGYHGYVTVEWEKAWLPGLAEPEEILPDAIKKLKEWAGESAEEAPAEKDHAKPAAKSPAVAAH